MGRMVVLGLLAACDAGRLASAPRLDSEVVDFAKGFSPALVGALLPEPVIAGDYALALDMSFDMFVTMEMRTSSERHGVIELKLGADHHIHGCVGVQSGEVVEGQYNYEADPKKRLGRREHRGARVSAISGSWTTVAGITKISIAQMWPGSCEEKGPVAAGTMIELKCIATKMTRVLPGHTLLCQEPPGDPLGLGMPLNVAFDLGSHMTAPSGVQLVLAPGGIAIRYATANRHDVTFAIVPQAVMIDPAAYK